MEKRCECECAHLRVLLEHLNLVPSPRFLYKHTHCVCVCMWMRGVECVCKHHTTLCVYVCARALSLLGLNIVAEIYICDRSLRWQGSARCSRIGL